jgi:leader peptidase (prepilin peptidase) / N-methyltransferase
MTMLQAFQTAPWLLITGAVMLGLVVGSFLNVVIHRLPRMFIRDWREQALDILTEWSAEESAPAALREIRSHVDRLEGGDERTGARLSLATPPSACPSCGHRITALENIPLLSYLVLRGRCSACRSPISLRYPVVEALAALLAGYIAWQFWSDAQGFDAPALVLGCFFAWTMIALAFIDLDTTFLPDDITQPLLWAGILVSFFGVFTDLPSSVLGAVFGYLAFWLVSKAWYVLRRVESMGHGDFKLLAAIGAWLGWQVLPQVIVISSMFGALVGVSLMIAGRGDLTTKIPFGPYLAIAGIVALVHGPAINQYYLRLLH